MKQPLCYIVLILVSVTARSQTVPKYYFAIGGTFSKLHQQASNDWHNSGFQYSFGLTSEKEINTRNLSFEFGIFYVNSIIKNFENSHYDYSTQAEVQLSTEIIRHDIQIRQLMKVKWGKLKFGGGALISYLLSSKINQEVKGEYSSSWMQSSYQAEYTIENNRSRSPLTRVNIAPCIMLEYQVHERLFLNFLGSYSILANPKTDYKFNNFNSLDLCISLAFKLNKTP
jgi:hypothetical protein